MKKYTFQGSDTLTSISKTVGAILSLVSFVFIPCILEACGGGLTLSNDNVLNTLHVVPKTNGAEQAVSDTTNENPSFKFFTPGDSVLLSNPVHISGQLRKLDTLIFIDGSDTLYRYPEIFQTVRPGLFETKGDIFNFEIPLTPGFHALKTVALPSDAQGFIMNTRVTIPFDSMQLRSNWNIVSPTNDDALFSALSTEPKNQIVSNAYFFNGSFYAKSDTLYKGVGYWIKTNAPCILYFDKPVERPPVMRMNYSVTPPKSPK